MPKKLFRLAMSATTSAVPTVNRYLYSSTAAVNSTLVKILCSKFSKDNGSNATAFVTAVANNGYFLLFVNGELEQSSIYTVAHSAITIAASSAFTIPLSGMVTLAVTNFAPTTSVRS